MYVCLSLLLILFIFNIFFIRNEIDMKKKVAETKVINLDGFHFVRFD